MSGPKKKSQESNGKKQASRSRGQTSAKRKPPSSAAGPKKAPVKSSAPASLSMGPLYALVIMVLLSIIIIMTNRYYKAAKPQSTDTLHENSAAAVKPDKDQQAKGIDSEKRNEIAEKKIPENVKEKVIQGLGREIKIYFIKIDDKNEKFFLASVVRKTKGNSLLREALDELVRGPVKSEKNRGFLSAVPENLKIRNVSIRNRTAVIDFNNAIEYNATGDILLNRIDQIVYTATQFDTIDSVIIKVNGKTRKSLGSDGLSIGGPLHRRE